MKKEKIFKILSIVFIVLTFIGAGYVIGLSVNYKLAVSKL